MADQEKRRKLLQAINSPLGFYVLALLIVETFLTLVLTIKGPANFLATGVWLGIGMFFLVILCVTGIAWFKPENLALSEDSYQERYMADRGDSLGGTTDQKVLSEGGDE